MPNNVTNIIQFEKVSPKKVEEILGKVKNDEFGIGSIDFNKILPMPQNIFRGDIKAGEIDIYGENNWYEWSLKNWETKWNAYNFSDLENPEDEMKAVDTNEEKSSGDENIEKNENSFEAVENKNCPDRLKFCTAWSPPHPIIERLSEMFPEAKITHRWADEDIGYNVGMRQYENGQLIYENIPCDGTKESYEMASQIMDIDLYDIGLEFSQDCNTYKFVERNEAEKEKKISSKIKVVLVKPMAEAKIVEIDSGLESMQKVVGGLIECIQPYNDEVALICNEEGKINRLEYNRAIRDEDGKIADIIAGDFFICAARFDDENFSALTDEEASKYCEKFKSPELFFMTNTGVKAIKVSERKAPGMER